MITSVLDTAIRNALWRLQIDESLIPTNITLEHPDNLEHGDYATNIAMVLAKRAAENPRELAVKIVKEILEEKPKEVMKVEVAGEGFINFYLSDSFYIDAVRESVKKGGEYGTNNLFKKERTIVEYTDPNPFKDFHIGHLMSNAIGESISRIIEANGAKVIRACYQGDVGLHVAKTIWAVKHLIAKKTNSRKEFFGGLFGMGRDPHAWGRAYAYGAKRYEEDEQVKKEIVAINKHIYAKDDAEINKIYTIGKKISLEEFEKIYTTLGTHFDHYFFESETEKVGKELVEKNMGNVFEKSDGAIIFKGENHGLHTRVFINSEGLPTYETKELGLAPVKYKATGFDRSIVVTASEQKEYFKVLLKVISLIFPDIAAKTSHISHGMMRLPEGKMSSRTGNIITGASFIEDMKEKVIALMAERHMSEREKKHAGEKIAVAAIKYSILRQASGTDIIFDPVKSLSFEGDSGPYLQYAYARARSIVHKAKKAGIMPSYPKAGTERVVSELEKLLYRYPEVVARAGTELAPHSIATYLLELASAYNGFYASGTIIDKMEKEKSAYKVALTESFSVIIKNGLDLLGIDTVERM